MILFNKLKQFNKEIVFVLLLFLSACGFSSSGKEDTLPLELALEKIENFQLRFYFADTFTSSSKIYLVAREKMSVALDSEIYQKLEYFVYDELESYYYFENNNEWTKVDSSSDKFKQAQNTLDHFNLCNINHHNYIMSGEDYVPRYDVLQKEAKSFFGLDDLENGGVEFEYLRIKVSNEKITNIYASAKELINNELITYTYILDFSHWGKVSIELPNV